MEKTKKTKMTKADRLNKLANRYNPERPAFLKDVNVQNFSRELKPVVVNMFQYELDYTEAALQLKAAKAAKKAAIASVKYSAHVISNEAYAYIPERCVTFIGAEEEATRFKFNPGMYDTAVDEAIEAVIHDRDNTDAANRAYYTLVSFRDVNTRLVTEARMPYEKEERAAAEAMNAAKKAMKERAEKLTVKAVTEAYNGELPEAFKAAIVSGYESVKTVDTITRVLNKGMENVRRVNALTAARTSAATLMTAYTWANLVRTDRDFTIGELTAEAANKKLTKLTEAIEELQKELDKEAEKAARAADTVADLYVTAKKAD